MSTTRAPLSVLIVCAPDDTPAVRSIAQRLRADGMNPTLAAELTAAGSGPRALRDALGATDVLLVCLSRRSWADGQLAPALANLFDLLPLTPSPSRVLLALRLASAELPPALSGAKTFDLFSASGYERLREALRAQADARAPAAPPPPPAPPPAPRSPALKLTGGFGLAALDRQGLLRRLGRGVARGLFLVDETTALVVSGGGPSLASLAGGPPRWAIDCPTRRAALSPDERLLALAADTDIALWDLAEGRLRGICLGHSGAVSGLAFAPDGRTLASGSHDRSVRLWRTGDDVSPPTPLVTLPLASDEVLSVAFSPDGALVAAGSADRSVHVWRTFDRACVQVLRGHGGAVEALAFSPDGALIAAGSRGHTAHLWSVATWSSRGVLQGHSGAVEALAFSPDGALIATASSDRSARLWRASDQVLLHTLSGHSKAVVAVAFSPSGAALATLAEDERLLAWSVTSGARTAELRPLSAGVTSLALSPDGAQLAVGARDGSLAVYGLEAEGGQRTRHVDHQGAIDALAFDGGGRLLSLSGDRSVRVQRPDGAGSSVLLQTQGASQGVALSPDGRLLACSDNASTVQLWRLSGPNEPVGGQFWRVLRGLQGRPRLVAFAPRSAAVAVVSDDGSLRIWRTADLEGDRADPAVTVVLGGPGRGIAFSPDGALVAVSTDAGGIQLWRAESGAPASSFSMQGRPVTSLAFSHDGRSLAAGELVGAIRVWRLGETRRRSAPSAIAGHAGAVTQLVFSPAGGTLVSASSDGTVRIWRV
jgi:WD40 repeat protein